MAHKIIVGKKYKIVGTKGGCNGGKCKTCYPYGVYITSITNYHNNNYGKTISGQRLDEEGEIISSSHCSFNPDDLVPFKPTSLKEWLENGA